MEVGVNTTPDTLFPGERYPEPIVQDGGRDLGPVWTGAEILAATGIRSPDRPVTIPNTLSGPTLQPVIWRKNISCLPNTTTGSFLFYSVLLACTE
jgi:hypothetical protein